jgi:hypothetical protein
VLRFVRNLGPDGTTVWLMGAWLIPMIAGTKSSRKNPFWLLAIVPWAITWGYPIGLLENPFSASESWPVGPVIYAFSVLNTLALTSENARQYVNRRDDAQQRPAQKGRR